MPHQLDYDYGNFTVHGNKTFKSGANILCSGSALAQAGPAPVFIGYSVVGLLCFMVMAALGEMAAWLPLPSGFTGYAHRFVDPALGFSLGWTYWFKVRF
jgi:amino acid transporter